MAGILPVTFENDKIYFLLSRETKDIKHRESGKWSDFGGSIEKGETLKQTAIREGYEESGGILGGEKKIKKLIEENLVKKYRVNNFTTHVVEISNMNKEKRKNMTKKFRKKYLDVLNNKNKKHLIFEHNGLYEKDMIRWVEITNIHKFYPKLRHWYKYVLRTVVNDFKRNFQ